MLLEIFAGLISASITGSAMYYAYKTGRNKGRSEGYTMAALDFEQLVIKLQGQQPQQERNEKDPETVTTRGNTFAGKASKMDN